MITVVSGLPRSGTSLMMQMLERAGMTVWYDENRKADASNPNGYYELEKVKSLERDNKWVGEAEGKVIKVVAPLLHALPSEYKYSIVFMERPIDEIIESQRAMLENRGVENNQDDDLVLKIAFEKQLRQIKDWLLLQGNMDVCFVEYPKLILNGYSELDKIERFFDATLKRQPMIEAIDKSLYKHRLIKSES